MIEPSAFPIWPLLRGAMLSAVMIMLLMGSCTVGCQVRAHQYAERCRDRGGVPSRLDCHMPRLTLAAPEGWVFRTAADFLGSWGVEGWRGDLDHYQRLAVRADFDGDGREDQAAVLLDEAFETFAVFAFPAGGAPLRLTEPRPAAALPGRSLAVEEPKGGGPARLVLEGGGRREAFAWDGRAFVKTAG